MKPLQKQYWNAREGGLERGLKGIWRLWLRWLSSFAAGKSTI